MKFNFLNLENTHSAYISSKLLDFFGIYLKIK